MSDDQQHHIQTPYDGQDVLQHALSNTRMSNEWLIPSSADKNIISRLTLYVQWLHDTNNHWTNPSLVAYANYLQGDERQLSASSIKSHLSTIRARYRTLINAPNFKRRLRAVANKAYPNHSTEDRRVLYLTVLEYIQDALNPQLTKHIKATQQQDTPDSQHLRLTATQAENLINTPGIRTIAGLRDTALIYFLFATGLREAEVCRLNVDDLRQTVNGELGVYIRHGKGAKERFVPYGELADCLIYVEAWLKQVNITKGAVFRGFKDRHIPYYIVGEKSPEKLYKRLTPRLTPRAVQNILKGYPVSIDGKLYKLRPHDTRRTYAKLLWNNGMDILAIRDNLGHQDVKTTQTYIGDTDMHKRRSPAMLHPAHQSKQIHDLMQTLSKKRK